MGAMGVSMLSRGHWLAIAGAAAVVLFFLTDDWKSFIGMIVFASIAVGFVMQFRSLVSRVLELEGNAVTPRKISEIDERIAEIARQLNPEIEK